MHTISHDSFETARKAAEQAYRALPSHQQDQLDSFVIQVGTQFIHCLATEPFLQLIQIRDRDALLRLIHPCLTDWLRHFQPEEQPAVTIACAGSVLAVMLTLWIAEACAHAGEDGWRTVYSNGLRSVVQDRLRNMEHEQGVMDFYRSLGTPTPAPSGPNPRADSLTYKLEDRTDLAPETKMNVLRNLMEARNHQGITTPDGVFRTDFLQYNRSSLEAARKFFEANPRLSVNQFAVYIYACCEALQEPIPGPREEDTKKTLRQCRNLGYLLLALPRLSQDGWLREYVDKYLGRKALFGRESLREP